MLDLPAIKARLAAARNTQAAYPDVFLAKDIWDLIAEVERLREIEAKYEGLCK